MRLWHYKLIPVLPKDMLVSQWRECIAIKRQWEKETLKHRLVSYVKNYDKSYFMNYVSYVINELYLRDIRFQGKYLDEILEFVNYQNYNDKMIYKEHNDRYLKQCYYNLQEKYDRGIVSEKEWELIENFYKKEI